MNQVNSRKQVMAILIELNGEGYHYLVRDEDSSYLSCYSLKPKKYRDTTSWGYVDPDAKNAMMVYPIKNTDITEINWSNKSAISILDFFNAQ